MVFEFLKWSASFETYKRGVKKGDIAFKRPHPFFDFTSKTEWLKFVVLLIGGGWIAWLFGVIAYFLVYVGDIMTWVYVFVGCWIVFCLLHLIHSIRFYKIAKLTNVEFTPLDKAEAISKRLLTIPEDLTTADYNILFSRYIWADVECEPYRDVTDWVERIGAAQTGGPAVSVGGGGFAESIGESIGASIGAKYSESKIQEIIDTAGGIPSPREIVKILQTELIPRYREVLGERMTMLYLLFLGTQPPVLPYDKETSRSEMREVARSTDTKEVLDYLNKFAPKMEEV